MRSPAVTATRDAAGDQPAPMLRAAFVRRPHGVRGDLRVEPLGGDVARFAAGTVLTVEGSGRPLAVRSARALPDGDLLLELEGISSREAAEQLRDSYLCVPEAARRRLGDREWFVYELVGLRVRTPEGEELGAVADVEEYPAHEVLVVRGAAGDIRLPMVADFVREVDLAAGVVTVTPWPEEQA